MTTDRAVKLGEKLAAAVLAGGPHPEPILRARIANLTTELLLAIDWRVLPGDEVRKDAELFSGQMEMDL